MASTDCCIRELQHALERANAQVHTTTNATEKRKARALVKRLQDRLYQRKHRAKREQKLFVLQTEVSKLHGKIARLYCELHRRKAEAEHAEVQRQQQQQHVVGSLLEHTISVASQFFRVYQNGYSLAMAAQQEQFLRSVLAVDVEGVDIHGANAFVQQWRLCGQHFDQFVLEPQAWKVQHLGDCVMAEVEVMLYVRFHRQTIASLFPSLRNGGISSLLVQPLVTGTTTVAGTLTFIVNRTGFVSSLLVNLQMVDMLYRVLGSFERVARLTEGACIALESGTIMIA